MNELIRNAIANIVGSDLPFSVEIPSDKTHGDYSTNVALVLAKSAGKNPRELAGEIAERLRTEKLFKAIDVAGPGFINFFIDARIFFDAVKKINKNTGKSNSEKGKKVIVEYTDPNILKDFHIGHLMSNTIGESISRVIEFQGANIKRTTWQSDVGIGIAKAVFGKMRSPDLSWQDAYVLGNKAYEEDEAAKKEIVALNKKIFERSDRVVNAVYDEGKKWSLNYFEGIYKRLGTHFNYYIFESEAVDLAKKIVEDGLAKGVFVKGENGAIIFKGEEFGLHTRVFINSEGLPTYEAKELGLAEIKYKKYRYDKSVIITGNEINSYFDVLLCVMKQTFPKLEEKTVHIGHGMMRLPEGKMSSRTGNVVTAESLIERVKESIKEKSAERNLDDETIERVAIGAIKYSILKQTVGSDIIFDFEKSISFEGDSGPYLQYAYVRAVSVLAKARMEKVKPSMRKIPETASDLEKLMVRFAGAVEKAANNYNPQAVALYLTELAAEFSRYYAENKIVDKDDELSPYKVALVEKFSLIMKNGLWLLGINVVEKM